MFAKIGTFLDDILGITEENKRSKLYAKDLAKRLKKDFKKFVKQEEKLKEKNDINNKWQSIKSVVGRKI